MPTSGGLSLRDLQVDKPDAIGAIVREIDFRGRDYAIYRSDRGVYVHFADDANTEAAQRAAYVKLSPQICELRYLTNQMRPGRLSRLINRFAGQDTLYDHNMGQALMLLMEAVAQRSTGPATEAAATEQEAKDIAQRALDMAVRRNTTDNTIRYVQTCVIFGFFWLFAALAVYSQYAKSVEPQFYVLASAAGIVGAVFSVIVRAHSFDLKPCDDSGMNKLMSLIRVGMGGLAGPALFLLLMTVSATALAGTASFPPDLANTPNLLRMVAVIGLLGGFAERLVPNLVQGAADKLETRAGTPTQAAQTAQTAQIGQQAQPTPALAVQPAQPMAASQPAAPVPVQATGPVPAPTQASPAAQPTPKPPLLVVSTDKPDIESAAEPKQG